MQKKLFKDHILFELEENDILSNLGIKVAYRKTENFLTLRKIRKNEKTTLICNTEGFEVITSNVLETEEQIISLFKALAEVLNICDDSAFMDYSYIMVYSDLIFRKESDDKYYFAVIPVDEKDYSLQRRNWEERLNEFVSEILSQQTICSTELLSFKNGILLANDKATFIKENAASLRTKAKIQSDYDLELAYNGPYGAFTFYICKESFTLGKSSDCDGVISMNSTVSRHHCTIKRSGGWTIVDQGSSNGTYINNIRLVPHQEMPIKSGDIVRISDMDFAIK